MRPVPVPVVAASRAVTFAAFCSNFFCVLLSPELLELLLIPHCPNQFHEARYAKFVEAVNGDISEVE